MKEENGDFVDRQYGYSVLNGALPDYIEEECRVAAQQSIQQ
jgi:hypothetical protein